MINLIMKISIITTLISLEFYQISLLNNIVKNTVTINLITFFLKF